MPGGDQLIFARLPSLNDNGAIGFFGWMRQSVVNSYLWEKGTLTEVLAAGAAAPGGGQFAAGGTARVNDQNQSILVTATLSSQDSSFRALYFRESGQLRAVAIPGQDMPGGGKLTGVFSGPENVSVANELGQYTFIGVLDDGAIGAYRIDTDGSLSLILKSGTTTALGVVTDLTENDIGGGIVLNSQGQVALVLSLAGQPDTLALLTPVAP